MTCFPVLTTSCCGESHLLGVSSNPESSGSLRSTFRSSGYWRTSSHGSLGVRRVAQRTVQGSCRSGRSRSTMCPTMMAGMPALSTRRPAFQSSHVARLHTVTASLPNASAASAKVRGLVLMRGGWMYGGVEGPALIGVAGVGVLDFRSSERGSGSADLRLITCVRV